MYEFPELSEYGAGRRLWQALDREADRLGLRLVECPSIGSGFVAVRLDGDPRVLNEALARLGINVVVGTRGREDDPEGEEEQERNRERVKQQNAAREAGRRPCREEERDHEGADTRERAATSGRPNLPGGVDRRGPGAVADAAGGTAA